MLSKLKSILLRNRPTHHHPRQTHRSLNLYEYQSKTLLAANACHVQRFCLLEAGKYDAIRDISAPEYVVKAQILPGDRGRGIFTSGFRGGVHLTKSRREAVEIAAKMLGQTLVTNETDGRGIIVERVIVAESATVAQRRYLCFTLDPVHGPSIYVSDDSRPSFDAKDGLSKTTKGSMTVYRVQLTDELPTNILKPIITQLAFGEEYKDKVTQEVANLWKVFKRYHTLYMAINPLILNTFGDIMCLDAKITIDNSALNLPHIQALLGGDIRDRSLQDYLADKLNYVNLGGNIGCIVDGAGLAMVTNDLLVQYGGRPANFANLNLVHNHADKRDNVHLLLDMLLSNSRITSLLVNINWSWDCAQIGRSLISTKLKFPIVLRLKGIGDEMAWRMLDASDLKVYRVADTEEAVRKVVALNDVSVQLLHNKSDAI